VSGLVRRALETRVAGDRSSPVRAALAAGVAGAVAAALTYKALRS
jgi:hypothetical protein